MIVASMMLMLLITLLPVPTQGFQNCQVRHYNSISRRKFEYNIRHQFPAVMGNLSAGWSGMSKWATSEQFIRKHGQIKVKLLDVNVDYDETRQEPDRYVSIHEYLTRNHEGQILLQFGHLTMYNELKYGYSPLPEILKSVNALPGIVLGRNHTGSGLHQHDESWLWHVAGRKFWIWIPPEPELPGEMWDVDPCQLMLQEKWPLGAKSCLVEPGDVIYTPAYWYHAVCNLDDFTLNIGGQGGSSHWPNAMVAVQDGDVQSVRNALADGATKQELLDFDESPLQLAATLGSAEISKLLLEHGFDAHALNWQHREPMQTAAIWGHTAVLDVFFDKNILPEDPQDISLASFATMGSHVETVDWLLQKMDPIEPKDATETTMHIATFYENPTIVERLLQHGEDPNVLNVEGLTALQLAEHLGRVSVIAVLKAVATHLDSTEF